MQNLMVVLTQTPPVKRIFYLEEKNFSPLFDLKRLDVSKRCQNIFVLAISE